MTTAAWGIPILFSSDHLWFDSHGAGRRDVAQTCPRNGSRRGPWHTLRRAGCWGGRQWAFPLAIPPQLSKGGLRTSALERGFCPRRKSVRRGSEEWRWRRLWKGEREKAGANKLSVRAKKVQSGQYKSCEQPPDFLMDISATLPKYDDQQQLPLIHVCTGRSLCTRLQKFKWC